MQHLKTQLKLFAVGFLLFSSPSFCFEPDDYYFGQQWNLERCNFPEAWEYSLPRRDYDTVTIAIFDKYGMHSVEVAIDGHNILSLPLGIEQEI